MKINANTIVKAIVILVFLTALPIISRQWIPQEFIKAVTVQSGFDVLGLLNRIAVIGVIIAVLVLLRGHMEKASAKYLALSVVWKIFWLFMVFFMLGLGYPETFGLAIIGGSGESTENIVVFDFRLFAVLATIIVVLMIVRSIMQFQEAKSKVTGQEAQLEPNL
jgi:hypothetical protein